jgi:putative ABC transport system permease protein
MNDLLQDIRYALRQLRRNPGFTVVAALTLALGIGSNLAMFTVVNAVLLRPLPYPDPERLVMVASFDTRKPVSTAVGPFVDPDIAQLRDQNRSFEAVAAFHGSQPTLTGQGEPALLSGMHVTEGFFRVFGVAPALGRTFLPEDYEQSPAQVVVVSEELWRGRFAADPGIVGQTIHLDGEPFTVVGVMPDSFRFPGATQIWSPSQLGVARNNAFRQVVARRKADVSIGQAQAELDTFAATFAAQSGGPDSHMGLRAVGLQDHIVGQVRSALWLFLGAVGFVLLIACANVAHLALARSEQRQREMTVRAALGAGRWRLARQLLIESGVLTLLGGSLAFLFALWGSGLLVAMIPPNKIPRLAEIAVDWRVFCFGLLLSLFAALLFGLAPAWRAAHSDLAPFLKESVRTTGSRGARRFRGLLIVGETAMAVVLLTGAALLLRSFGRLLDVNPGFRPENVLSMSVSLPQPIYQTPRQMTAFYESVLERLSAQPGVAAAGLVNWRPLGQMLLSGSVSTQPRAAGREEIYASKILVSPGYFGAMGIPLRRGRDFTAADREDSAPVVIISESLARLLWKQEDPVGRRLDADLPGVTPWVTVAAVVGDINQSSLAEDPPPALYLPYRQVDSVYFLPLMSFVVRTQSDPMAMAEILRQSVTAADPNIPVYEISTMEQVVWESVAEPRFQTLLIGLFSALALTLAAIGIYGVISYSVATHVREIGVRLALGARTQDVTAMFVRRGLGLTLAGLAVGAAGALALTRLISKMLFAVTPTDPFAFAAAFFVLVAAALAASYVPARRAAAVDPAVALRDE